MKCFDVDGGTDAKPNKTVSQSISKLRPKRFLASHLITKIKFNFGNDEQAKMVIIAPCYSCLLNMLPSFNISKASFMICSP